MLDRLSLFTLLTTGTAVLFILELVRRRHLREKYALLWLGVGVLMVTLSVGRPVVDRVSLAVGITYGPSVVFLFSTLFLAGVAAHLSYEVSKLEEKTRLLAEEVALMRPRSPEAQNRAEP